MDEQFMWLHEDGSPSPTINLITIRPAASLVCLLPPASHSQSNPLTFMIIIHMIAPLHAPTSVVIPPQVSCFNPCNLSSMSPFYEPMSCLSIKPSLLCLIYAIDVPAFNCIFMPAISAINYISQRSSQCALALQGASTPFVISLCIIHPPSTSKVLSVLHLLVIDVKVSCS